MSGQCGVIIEVAGQSFFTFSPFANPQLGDVLFKRISEAKLCLDIDRKTQHEHCPNFPHIYRVCTELIKMHNKLIGSGVNFAPAYFNLSKHFYRFITEAEKSEQEDAFIEFQDYLKSMEQVYEVFGALREELKAPGLDQYIARLYDLCVYENKLFALDYYAMHVGDFGENGKIPTTE